MKNASDIAFDFNSIFWTGPWWLVLIVLVFFVGLLAVIWGIIKLTERETVSGVLLIATGVLVAVGSIVYTQTAYNDSRSEITRAFSDQGLIVNPDKVKPGNSFFVKDKSNNLIECTIIDDGFDNHYSVICFK